MNLMRRRVLMNKLVMALSGLAAAIGLFFLIWILGYVTVKGIGAINWELANAFRRWQRKKAAAPRSYCSRG